MADQVTLDASENVVSPIPCTGFTGTLLASTALTTNPGGGVSGIVSVKNFRKVTLWIIASVDAANAYAHIIPLVSGKKDLPLIGDDSWFGLSIVDVTPTPTLLAGTLQTGADYTIAPEWAVVTARPFAR